MYNPDSSDKEGTHLTLPKGGNGEPTVTDQRNVNVKLSNCEIVKWEIYLISKTT